MWTQKTALLQPGTQVATQELFREPTTIVNGLQSELDYRTQSSFCGKERLNSFHTKHTHACARTQTHMRRCTYQRLLRNLFNKKFRQMQAGKS